MTVAQSTAGPLLVNFHFICNMPLKSADLQDVGALVSHSFLYYYKFRSLSRARRLWSWILIVNLSMFNQSNGMRRVLSFLSVIETSECLLHLCCRNVLLQLVATYHTSSNIPSSILLSLRQNRLIHGYLTTLTSGNRNQQRESIFTVHVLI